MRNTLLTICRLTLAAWVGAATLFVVTGIREVTSAGPHVNNSVVKDELVGIRFPAYYAFGFALVGVSLLCTFGLPASISLKRRRWIMALLAAALLLMIADYFWIYEPLLEMITPPGKARSMEFVSYHEASKYINAVDVGLCLVAAVLVCRPVSPRA